MNSESPLPWNIPKLYTQSQCPIVSSFWHCLSEMPAVFHGAPSPLLQQVIYSTCLFLESLTGGQWHSSMSLYLSEPEHLLTMPDFFLALWILSAPDSSTGLAQDHLLNMPSSQLSLQADSTCIYVY